MQKGEFDRMQERARGLPAESPIRFGAAVKSIADERMPELLRVNANLMHASRLDIEPYERNRALASQHLVMRDRPQPITSDQGINRPLRRLRRAVANGEIGLTDILMGLELATQIEIRRLRPREDHHARGILVETMNDARTRLGADAAHLGKAPHQLVRQRALFMSRRGMHDLPRRLIDDDNGRILKENFQIP